MDSELKAALDKMERKERFQAYTWWMPFAAVVAVMLLAYRYLPAPIVFWGASFLFFIGKISFFMTRRSEVKKRNKELEKKWSGR